MYWQSLGFFSTTTNNFAVQLSNNANGYVTVDAIRLVAGGITPQQPEMDVSRLQRSIATEDEAPALEDGTDFGEAPLFTDSALHRFTITNNGNADLILTGVPRVSILGPHAADFSVVSQANSLIAPGKSTSFEVVFDPMTPGPRTAAILIANNDATEHPYVFALLGNAGPQAEMLVHNAALPQDVNADNRVNANDALILINRLLSGPAAQPLTTETDAYAVAPRAAAPSYYYDVNDDSRVNSTDLLMVINYLLQSHAGQTAAPLAAEPAALAAVDDALVLFDLPEAGDEIKAARVELPAVAAAVAKRTSNVAELLIGDEVVSLLEEGDEDTDNDGELVELPLLP